VNAWYSLGNLLAGQQRYDEAEQAYKTAIKHRPDLTEAWNNLGNILKNQQMYDEAEESLIKALSFAPKKLSHRKRIERILEDDRRKL